MRRLIFDMECDSLLDTVTKCHIVAYQWEDEDEVKFITDEARMKKFFQQEDVIFVGHNIIWYDMRVVKKLWDIDVPYKRCIDTLALSWYLYDDRLKHGLESWGDEVGFPKVKVGKEEWAEGNMELMTDRVREDVKINSRVWKLFKWNLEELYDGDWRQIEKLIHYQGFKLDCVVEQEETGVRVDVPRVNKALEGLYKERDSRVDVLVKAMPKVPVKAIKKYPKVRIKKDGSPSAAILKWKEFLKENGIGEDYTGDVEYIKDYKEPKPNSPSQIKDWLYSLGWKPQHIKFVRNKDTNEVKQIPQITNKLDKTEICPSVKKLAEKEPSIEALSGLAVINHRIGILEGFLRDMKPNGRIYASASRFAVSMRSQHKYLVNLPQSDAPYAEDIRRSLIADEGCVLIDSDLAGIESTSRYHYIYDIDPEYVKDMNTEGYDAHTNIAVLSGMMTEEEEELYKSMSGEEDKSKFSKEEMDTFKRVKDIRSKAKTVNFAALYGVSAKTLHNNTDMPEKDCQKLLDTYWSRNWSVKEFAEKLPRKSIGERNWILNPVSGFWMYLKREHNAFSIVNQSTGQYVLDVYTGLVRNKGIKVWYTYHDALTTQCKEKEIPQYKEILKSSMETVNKLLKWNVPIKSSFEYAKNYGDCH